MINLGISKYLNDNCFFMLHLSRKQRSINSKIWGNPEKYSLIKIIISIIELSHFLSGGTDSLWMALYNIKFFVHHRNTPTDYKGCPKNILHFLAFFYKLSLVFPSCAKVEAQHFGAISGNLIGFSGSWMLCLYLGTKWKAWW